VRKGVGGGGKIRIGVPCRRNSEQGDSKIAEEGGQLGCLLNPSEQETPGRYGAISDEFRIADWDIGDKKSGPCVLSLPGFVR